jgi:hypothetical protein
MFFFFFISPDIDAAHISQNINLLVRLASNDKLLRQTDIFYAEEVTTRSRNSQISFKKELARLYSHKKERYYNHLTCLVTGERLLYQECIAGHIVPHSAAQRLVEFGLSSSHINDSTNGMLWAQGIEDVFHPAGKVCILYDFLHNKLVFKVLDISLLDKIIKPTSKKFKDVDGTALSLPENVFPKKRFIWCHARAAILAAHEQNLININSEPAWSDSLNNIEECMNFIFKNPQCDSDEAIKRMSSYNRASEEINDEVSTSPNPNTLLCYGCNNRKQTVDFSRNQLKKGDNRKCMTCLNNTAK